MDIGDFYGFMDISEEPSNRYLPKLTDHLKGGFTANVQTVCPFSFLKSVSWSHTYLCVTPSLDVCLHSVFYFWPNRDFGLLAFMPNIKRQTSWRNSQNNRKLITCFDVL